MRVLIVDDEPLARRELRRLLKPFSTIEIVGEAQNIDEAEARIAELLPDLVFLDIQMPGGNGFDLLARLEQVPNVVFTTAYDRHAVQAFEVNALDYLLKPVDPKRLAAALERARLSERKNTQTTFDQLFVRDGAKCWFVPLREVRVLESEGNYIKLYWKNLRPMLNRSLVALESRLNARQFFRANRRQIINLDFVEEIEVGEGGVLHIQLREGPEIEVSRRQARIFRMQMSGKV